MRTKAEIEAMLPKDSKEREQALKSLEHSFSMYDFSGNHKPHPYEKENLLNEISQRDTYVIDSNSDWKKECKENLDKAFIISPPLSRENPNTKDLILEAQRCKLGNIFSVGIDASLECVLVDRIDQPFRYVFDIAKLTEASKGKGPIVANQKVEIWKTIEREKKLIRDHIGLAFLFAHCLNSPTVAAFVASGKASDLPSPDKIPSAVGLLKTDIARRIRECKHNIGKSKIAAEACYATLLIEDTAPNGIRSEFDEPNYENVFGDMHIATIAIFLGANILTKDRKLTQMAGYAGIKCYHVPQTAKKRQ